MSLYHVDVFMPEVVKTQLPRGLFPLVYSDHAMRAARSDRYSYSKITLPDYIETHSADCQLIEAEYDNGKIIKAVYRIPYSDFRDLCIAVTLPDFVVKTVWLCAATDNHSTLKRFKYARS